MQLQIGNQSQIYFFLSLVFREVFEIDKGSGYTIKGNQIDDSD